MSRVADFLEFMEQATVAVTAVATTKARLDGAGFSELKMSDNWPIAEGGKYYVSPYPSMVIAFTIGAQRSLTAGFRLIGAHTDCPGFRIKPNPEITTEGYLKLNTEVYGGPILNTWMDRLISIAGKVALKSDQVLYPEMRLVDFKRPLLTIPNLAIHMNRDVNQGVELKKQKDMLPLIGQVNDNLEASDYMVKLLAEELKVSPEDILDFELFLYAYEPSVLVGAAQEFISSPRIDDLAMVYAIVEALIDGTQKDGINVAVLMDNEEVGSTTKQGADSVLLATVLERISISLNRTPVAHQRTLAHSFMISADGAHALHPNAPEKNDLTNKPLMNKGIVVKISASQSYTSESETVGAFQQLCMKAEVPFQKFVNHSDNRGGSTIGPISSKYLPIRTVDVGIPMLAMHSARELMGVKDLEDSIQVFTTFYRL